MSGSRSWARGQKAEPEQPQSPEHAHARHLAVTARRFIADRASAVELDEAVHLWLEIRGPFAAADAEGRATRAAHFAAGGGPLPTADEVYGIFSAPLPPGQPVQPPRVGPGEPAEEREVFVCPYCGEDVAAAEDGTCTLCGADTFIRFEGGPR